MLDYHELFIYLLKYSLFYAQLILQFFYTKKLIFMSKKSEEYYYLYNKNIYLFIISRHIAKKNYSTYSTKTSDYVKHRNRGLTAL